MAQVYACFHDGKGSVLVIKKNSKGYFFHNPNGPGGAIVPDGQPLNGGGDFCFPGGRLESNDVVEAALKEFLEETNVAVNPAVYRPIPEVYHYKGAGEYYGVYFCAPKGLEDIAKSVYGNLVKGAEAAKAVQAGFKGTYDQLRDAYKYCPQDDELSTEVHIVPLNKIGDFFKKDSKTTGWFYTIATNLIKSSVEST